MAECLCWIQAPLRIRKMRSALGADLDTLKGKRERAMLAVLLGCSLRRRELADLQFWHL